MSWHRSSGFCAVAIVALALLTASPALGAVAGIDRELPVETGGGHPGDADFGSGFHANGNPTGPYTVTWDFTPSDGVVRVNARIKGTLYVDRIGSGCVRLLIDLQDFDFNLLARQPFPFCGPDSDANNSANQRPVDFSSVSIPNFPGSGSEASNSFSRFHPHTGRFGEAVQPGSHARFHGSDVTLLLDGTEVIGSGPTGPSVVLNLALKFKPGAAGRTFAVEMKRPTTSGACRDGIRSGASRSITPTAGDIREDHHGRSQPAPRRRVRDGTQPPGSQISPVIEVDPG
jgi:hypothetical protein